MVDTIITANAETRKPLTVGPKLDVERNSEQKMGGRNSESEHLVSDLIARAGMPSFPHHHAIVAAMGGRKFDQRRWISTTTWTTAAPRPRHYRPHPG